MTKIAIAGSGAMGRPFWLHATSRQNDVVLLDNWVDVQAIIQGLTVAIVGQDVQHVQIPALPTAIKDVQDVIIIFTKSMQLGAMLQSIKPLIGEKTKVVCLLNGLVIPKQSNALPKHNISSALRCKRWFVRSR